jgi:hypothetical protein
MTMTSPTHEAFSQIRLSVPVILDKEKHYQAKLDCTHKSPRKKSPYTGTVIL